MHHLLYSLILFINYTVEYLLFFHYAYIFSRLINIDLTLKQVSYISSIKSSVTMTVLGLLYFFNFEFDSFETTEHVIFFTAYLFTDLVIGTVYYPTHVGLLTGYLHHIVYIAAGILSIGFNVEKEYMSFMILEIPTVIFSFGNFHKDFRFDYIFGVSFFLTRICYHIYLTLCYVKIPVILSFSMHALIVHFYWFYNWFIKYYHV